ncbi:hypothetical protein FJZ40_00665 [Candidatus Shapirobacteria bacterium]|nr:hypothetical protein [Candidatus Shapirobacteria bacterium]
MPFNFRTEYSRYRKYFLTIPRFYQYKRVRVYTGLILTLFTISFFAFFAIRPTIVTIASLVAEIRAKEELNQELDKKIQSVLAAQVAYSQIAPRLVVLDAAFPVGKRFAGLLPEIENAGNTSGASVSGIAFEGIGAVKEKEPKEISFSISLLGSFESLTKFLASSFSLPRAVKADAFSLSKSAREGDSQNLTLQGKFKSYYYDLPK